MRMEKVITLSLMLLSLNANAHMLDKTAEEEYNIKLQTAIDSMTLQCTDHGYTECEEANYPMVFYNCDKIINQKCEDLINNEIAKFKAEHHVTGEYQPQ